MGSKKAFFSAALIGGLFVIAMTVMTSGASASWPWQTEARASENVGKRAQHMRRATTRQRQQRAAARRKARRDRAAKQQNIRHARVIRTAPLIAEDKCRPHLAVVGDQYASEQGAQQEADKAWMQTARWQWGERYMAREHANEAAYECGRSSVGSVVGQVFYRCRLTARPCRPDTSPGR